MPKSRDCTCPECGGEGGWPIDPDRRVKSSYDWGNGETHYSNWEDCDECGGSGEIEQENDNEQDD